MKRAIVSMCLVLLAACGSHSQVGRAVSNSPTQKVGSGNDLEKDPRIVTWRELDVKCHQLEGEASGPQACAQRAQFEKQLQRQGLCYGKRGEPEYRHKWDRCAPDSLRFNR